MYQKKQVEPLLAAATALIESASSEGCDKGLVVISRSDLVNLQAQANYLAALNQRMVIAQHDHRHGVSSYAYLVPEHAATFFKEDFIAILGDEFEPDRGESVVLDNYAGSPDRIGWEAGWEDGEYKHLDTALLVLAFANIQIVPDADQPGMFCWVGSDISYPSYPEAVFAAASIYSNALHKCQNCDALWEEDDLNEIRHMSERVSSGEIMPSGECPTCGAVCHPIYQKE